MIVTSVVFLRVFLRNDLKNASHIFGPGVVFTFWSVSRKES